MRDPARETAYCFHLLRLAQLLFQAPPFGHVFSKQFEYEAASPTIRYRAAGNANYRSGSVVAFPVRSQPLKRFCRTKEIGEGEPLIVVRIKSENMLPNQLVGGRVAQHRKERRIHVENLACGIAAADPVGGIGDQ